MSVDITQLSAHLAPDRQGQVKKAYQQAAKHDTTGFLLCFFLGLFGAHRFYLNQFGSGLAHLGLTALGVAAIVAGFLTQQPINFVLFVVGVLLLLIGLIWEAMDLFAIDSQIYKRNLTLAERLIADAALADPTVLNQASAQLDRVVRETAARSAQAPASTASSVGFIGDAEVADARAFADEGATTATTKYVSMSRMQLSDDPMGLPGDERQPGPGDPTNNWSTTQTTYDQLPAEAGAAAIGLGAGATLTESVTHSHEEGGYRATDSYEVDRSIGPNEPQATPAQDDAYTIPAAPAETPSGEIAMDDTTWPDYPPVAPVEAPVAADPAASPVADMASYEPDSAPAGSGPSLTDDLLLGGAALGAGALGLGAYAAARPEAGASPAPAPTSQGDMTDAPSSSYAEPVADVAHPGAAPVHIELPETPTAFTPAANMAALAPLYLAPEEPVAEPSFTPFAAAPEPAYGLSNWEADEIAPAPEEYVPPIVPMGDATGMATYAAAPAPLVDGMDAMDAATQPATWPAEPQPEPEPASTPQPERTSETLAELAGFAGLAGAGAVAGAALTHAEPAAPLEPEPTPPPAAPVAPATDPNLIVGEGGQLMKRVRVKRRLVVDGEVISEEVREEIVPVDMDTATAAAQLQASLGQATAEEIAQKAHLSPEEIELHRRTEGGSGGGVNE